jgi:hypothetical protein
VIAAYRVAVQITLVVAIFFIVIALIALARTLYTKVRPPKRWRVGLFVERDGERDEETKP